MHRDTLALVSQETLTDERVYTPTIVKILADHASAQSANERHDDEAGLRGRQDGAEAFNDCTRVSQHGGRSENRLSVIIVAWK